MRIKDLIYRSSGSMNLMFFEKIKKMWKAKKKSLLAFAFGTSIPVATKVGLEEPQKEAALSSGPSVRYRVITFPLSFPSIYPTARTHRMARLAPGPYPWRQHYNTRRLYNSLNYRPLAPEESKLIKNLTKMAVGLT